MKFTTMLMNTPEQKQVFINQGNKEFLSVQQVWIEWELEPQETSTGIGWFAGTILRVNYKNRANEMAELTPKHQTVLFEKWSSPFEFTLTSIEINFDTKVVKGIV